MTGAKQSHVQIDEVGFRTDLAAHMMTLAARVIRPKKGKYDSEEYDDGFTVTLDDVEYPAWVARFTAGFASEMHVRVYFVDAANDSTNAITVTLTSDLEVRVEESSIELNVE